MQVSLKVARGKSAGKEIPIPVSVFLIGRSDDCHLRPKSDAISRRHCELTIESDSVWVKDLGSRNGTYVDGTKITERTEVRNGSQLKIGKLAFEVVISAPAVKSEQGFDVSDWLANDEATAKQEKHLAEPETRQFKLDETSQDPLKKGDKSDEVDSPTVTGEADLDTETGSKQTIDPAEAEEDSKDDTTGFFLSKKKEKKEKSKPKKLPSQSGPSTDSSTAAAAETLKNFFNNRS